MTNIAIITGAGSGVGQAVALSLARLGWSLALLGRREQPLHETITRAGNRDGKLIAIPTDVADESQVRAMADRVQNELGDATALVNSAGLNIARRGLDVLSPDDFRKVIDANLTGAYLCAHVTLPMMHRAGGGTIVNVVSDAGLRGNAISGAAYIASKFGMVGLTQAINAEQRDRNIRACAVCPGEINTPLLDKRPSPPPMEARKKMLQSEDVAAAILLCLTLPPRAVVEQLVLLPR